VPHGTPLDGAALEIEAVPIGVACPDCGVESELDGFPLACPACGGLAANVVRGEELQVEVAGARHGRADVEWRVSMSH
jgi:hydrogenase nickel incorporation protein HypA/HybF